MKRILIVCFILIINSVGNLFAQGNITSQEYKTALGVKFYPGAVTIKHFLNEKAAIEGLGYFWNRGARITGLYEFHWDISNAAGLKWYVGPGAHVGFYNAKYGGGSSVGVDGVIGLDYTFKGAPINLAVDWQPSVDFDNKNVNVYANWVGLAFRYVFQ